METGPVKNPCEKAELKETGLFMVTLYKSSGSPCHRSL